MRCCRPGKHLGLAPRGQVAARPQQVSPAVDSTTLSANPRLCPADAWCHASGTGPVLMWAQTVTSSAREIQFLPSSQVRSSKETLLLPTQHLLTYKPSASSLWMIKTKVPSFLFRPSQDQKCNSFPKTPAQLFLSLKPHKGRTINQSHLFLLPACAQAHRSTCHLTRSATTREIDGRSLVFPEVLWWRNLACPTSLFQRWAQLFNLPC